jgi:hypothetical protein
MVIRSAVWACAAPANAQPSTNPSKRLGKEEEDELSLINVAFMGYPYTVVLREARVVLHLHGEPNGFVVPPRIPHYFCELFTFFRTHPGVSMRCRPRVDSLMAPP